MTKKRLALLYSGQPRALELCTYNHRKMIIEANPEWDVDIFVHFLFTQKTKLGDRNKDKWPKEEKDLRQFIQKHWQPKDFVIEKAIINQQFDEDENNPPPWRQEHHKTILNYRNYRLYHAAMCYGIEMANTLKKQYENKHGFVYDCAMRIRSDIFFRHPVTIGDCDPNSVYVLLSGQKKNTGKKTTRLVIISGLHRALSWIKLVPFLAICLPLPMQLYRRVMRPLRDGQLWANG